MKDLTQIALQGEMDSHLAEDSLEQGSNRRNGITTKTMRTGTGAFELEVPRDRNSSFEPQLIKKRQTILNEELDNKILALYGLGTSYDGIVNHLQEIYGVEVSSATISNVTDKLVPMLNEWRTRPVEAIYAVVWECSSNCVILKIISQISVYLENKYPAGKLPKPNLISAYSI